MTTTIRTLADATDARRLQDARDIVRETRQAAETDLKRAKHEEGRCRRLLEQCIALKLDYTTIRGYELDWQAARDSVAFWQQQVTEL
jgi:hypothetical protein